MKAIQTLSLTKRYRHGPPACDQISLTVNQGDIFGLLGPNGAGKSTLVKMLVGLVSPSAGSARVLGFSFKELAPRRHMGYLPELFRFPPWLKASEVLDFHARLLHTDLDHDERDALLARVGLDGHGSDRVRTFSKGMQQRLGLAVALIGRPELVILDEPTSALDPIGRFEVGEILKELKRAGVTIFLNSHLLSDVEKICNSVALIDRGQVLYQGTLKEAIYGGVRRYRLKVDKFDAPREEALKKEHPGLIVGRENEGTADIEVQLLRDQLPDLVAQLVSLGARVYEVEPDHSSLEEWFLRRVRKDSR